MDEILDVMKVITPIIQALGLPSIIAAIAANITSRRKSKVNEKVLEDLMAASGGWSFVKNYELNRAVVRDRELKRIVLLRDSCVGEARDADNSSKKGQNKDDGGSKAGANAKEDGGGRTQPAHMGGGHKLAYFAACVISIILLALLSVPLLLQLLAMLPGQISVEGLIQIINCVLSHSELWPIGGVSVVLLPTSVLVVFLTKKQRKYLNTKMHSLLPVLTGVIVVLAFCLGVSLLLESKVVEGSVTAPDWWHVVPPLFLLVTVALVLAYTVVVWNVSEEYAIRETCREKFFTGLLDRDELKSFFDSIDWFKGLMTTSEILFMETALMAGWLIMSIILAIQSTAPA